MITAGTLAIIAMGGPCAAAGFIALIVVIGGGRK